MAIALKLPLSLDSADGFTMIKDYRTLIKQNFKMLLLTNPGERIMSPSYGVGINQFLFSNFDQATFSNIETRIRTQTQTYLPVVQIEQIEMDSTAIDSNTLQIRIKYAIPSLNYTDFIDFTI